MAKKQVKKSLRKPLIYTALVVLVLAGLGLSTVVFWKQLPFYDIEAAKRAHFQQGEDYFKQNKYREAVIEYKNVIQLDPSAANAHFGVGRAAVKMGDKLNALRSLHKSLEINPDLVEAQLLLARLYYEYRDPSNCILMARKVLERRDDTEARILMSLAAADKGEYIEAIDQIKAVLQKEPEHLHAQIHLSRIHYLQKEYVRSETLLKDLVAKHDTSFAAVKALAEFYTIQKLWPQAEQVMQQALARFDTVAAVHIMLADLHEANGRLEQAEAAYLAALEVDPDDPQLHFLLAQFYLLEQRFAEAKAHYKKALEKNPDHLVAKKQLAYMHQVDGEVDLSDSLVKQLLKRLPQDVDCLYLKGRVFIARKEYKRATEMLANVYQTNPAYVFNIYPHDLGYLLGLSYHSLEQYVDARQALTQAVQINPGLTHAYLLLADSALRLGDRLAAEVAAQKVLDEDPDNLTAQLFLGQALMASGKAEEKQAGLDKTVSSLKKATDKSPDDIRGKLYLAQSYFSSGKRDLAEKVLLEAMAKHDSALSIDLTLARFYQVTGARDKAETVLRRAIEKHPTRLNAYLHLGRHLQMMGKEDEAEQVLLQAVTAEPENSLAHFTLGRYFAEHDRGAEAIKHYTKALKLAPRSLEVKRWLAYQHLKAMDYQQVSKLVKLITVEQPNDVAASYFDGRMKLALGENVEARESLKWVDDRVPHYIFGNDLGELPVEYYLTLAYMRTGDMVEARKTLRRLPPRYAEQPLVKLLDIQLARKLGAQVNNQVAVESAEVVLQNNPDDLVAYMLLADAYMYDGRIDQALAAFKKVLALQPDHIGALLGMGQLFWVRGQAEAAREMWEKLLAVDKNSFKALQLIMNSHVAEGQPDKALARCDIQIRKSRANVGFRQLRAILLIQTGEFTEARSELEKALSISPQNAQTYFVFGSLYQTQQQMGKAKEKYEKALELNPQHAMAANNLAWIYLEVAGDVERAWGLADRAYTYAPRDPNVMDTLGWIYYKNNSHQRAVQLFQGAVSQKPDEPIYHYHLGMAQYKMGAREEARVALKKSLDLDPEHSDARTATQILKELGAG